MTLTIAPASFALSTISNDVIFQTATGAMQVQSKTGTRYKLVLNFRRGGADMRTLRGQLASVQGRRNRLYVPMAKLGYIKGGTGDDAATLSGNHSAGATSLNLAGLAAGVSNILLAGDFIEIGSSGQLTQVTTALSASGSPNTIGSVSIWPPLQKDRASGVAVNLTTPGGMFIMISEFGFSGEPMPTASNWYSDITVELEQDVLA